MEGVCPPYPGDWSHMTRARAHTHVWCANNPDRLCRVCFWCVHEFLCGSCSDFTVSYAWSCSRVSRAMFPEAEQQTVSQMMATESNYYRPAALQCMVMRFWLSFPLCITLLLNLWHRFSFISTQKEERVPTCRHFPLFSSCLSWRKWQGGSA